MSRRTYAKGCCSYVLDQILSGEATETVVENIHEYLATIGQQVRAGKIKLEEFIIHKVCLGSLFSTDSVLMSIYSA